MKNLLLITIFISCSHLKLPEFGGKANNELELKGYKEFTGQDYVDQLVSLGSIYLDSGLVTTSKLSWRHKKYLEEVVAKIRGANELFFKDKFEPEFYLVQSEIPFHFSLPRHKFFFSTSLLKKYVKNETMLYCLLVYELIRSERRIYEKRIIIPTKAIDTQRILSLLRLDTEDKVEVHKWAFYLLKRIGLESDSYLSWLQIKNRNSLDFTMQLGDTRSISREEALFKAFLIDNYLTKNKPTNYKGSSKSFYSLLRSI